MNFKEETIEAIEESGHKLEDVMFVGSSDGKYRITINKFLEISDFDYDDGYGSAAIATDLIVYFKDSSYITRGEYDGSEWWEYNKPKVFNMNEEYKDFDILGGNRFMWKSVKEMNDDRYDEEGYLKEKENE